MKKRLKNNYMWGNKHMQGNKNMWHYHHSNGLFWGLFILVLGIWFLAKDLGWISLNISIWPIVLIVLGIWLIAKRKWHY